MIKDKIAGNRREKIDILFNNNYGISVKTLMHNNTEINLGSFEKNVLFDNFEVEQYLTERTNKEAIGLGSKPQLKNLLNLIKKNGHYNEFKERFIKMYGYIFNDDMIILIKNDLKAQLYFFSGLDFTNFMNSKIEQIDSFLEIINRWEGNSIRIDRTQLLKECNKKIELDFSIFKDTIIETINNFDYQLHRIYVEYFNEPYNLKFKNNLIDTLDDMFYKFDNWLKLIN